MKEKSSNRHNILDFTEKHYRYLIKTAKKNYLFEPFTTKTKSPHILWRHDIDFSIHRASSLAKIENELGVKATYFLKLHSEFYNLFEKSIFEKVLKIIEFGHNIGLHFEHHFYNNNKKKLEENLRSEKKILEKIFSVDVKVFSFDSPTLSNALNVSDNKISSMVNAYGQRIKNNYHYCTDSNGYWRFERLADVLESREYPYLHILTHPGWWQKNPMKPRQRVERCVKHRGLETLKIYDKILKETGRKNIG